MAKQASMAKLWANRVGLAWISAQMRNFWRYAHPVVTIMRYTRVATLSVVLGGAGLLLTGQGRELGLVVAAQNPEGSFVSYVLFVLWLVLLELVIALWAVVCYGAAHVALDESLKDQRKHRQGSED